MEKLKIDLIPDNFFVDEKGIFKLDEALMLSGKFAGVCYDKEGFDHLKNEDPAKTRRRIDMTLSNGHHSVYDHIYVSLNITNIPKILAMVLNNEKQYTTSEKSARYTPVEKKNGSTISDKEIELYNKWKEILKVEIAKEYGNVFNEKKIDKLAQENARYMITVFMPTTLIYTTSLRQINYLVSWMKKYIKENANSLDNFNKRLAGSMQEFVDELDSKGLLKEELMANDKHRDLSLFGQDVFKKEDYFGDVYSTKYHASFAYLAQAQRHRTINYEMERQDVFVSFIPPILLGDYELVQKWIDDMYSVKDISPQGQLIRIHEFGTYENFILKCKERLCSAAQLEINNQTRELLLQYKRGLERREHPLVSDIEKYSHGARCTFPDFQCKSPCGFAEGVKLTRKI
jgi:thymidylate synthase ThyX